MTNGIMVPIVVRISKLSAHCLTPAMNWLKSAKGPLLIVFAYHGVTDRESVAKLSYGLHVLDVDFDRHCSVIAANFRTNHIEGFLEEATKNSAQIYALLTFDDGYRNVATTALPILEKYRLKFMLFLSTDYVGRTTPFWWDKVRLGFLSTPFSRIEVDGHTFDLSTLRARENSMFAFESYLADLSRESREQLVEEFYATNLSYVHRTFGKILGEFSPINYEKLDKLRSYPLCKIGLHSASHPALTGLPALELERELSRSQQWYRNWCQNDADDICFPFGTTNEQVNEACRKFGFRRGFTLETHHPGRLAVDIARTPFPIINRYVLHPHDDYRSIVNKANGSYDPLLRLFGADAL